MEHTHHLERLRGRWQTVAPRWQSLAPAPRTAVQGGRGSATEKLLEYRARARTRGNPGLFAEFDRGRSGPLCDPNSAGTSMQRSTANSEVNKFIPAAAPGSHRPGALFKPGITVRSGSYSSTRVSILLKFNLLLSNFVSRAVLSTAFGYSSTPVCIHRQYPYCFRILKF